MCEFCLKHGEGKKWYEVMANYSEAFRNNPSRQAYIRHFVKGVRQHGLQNLSKLQKVKEKLPVAYRFVRKMATQSMKANHFGQVVPVEDVEKILDMVQSITRIPCVCRSVTTGRNDARYCLVLGIDPTGSVNDWPELKTSLETLTAAEAKALLQTFDQKGLVHSIWTFKTPYIGAICNCDRDCLAYRFQVGSDLLTVMFKAEYVAFIDPLACTGCRNCLKLCQFGAIEYSATQGRCVVNTEKCYGCGLCRTVCNKRVVSLEEREVPI